MNDYIIKAGYIDLHGNDIVLGKFKTEEKAWEALEVEGLKLKRLAQDPVEVERHFEDNCYVLFISSELV